MKSFRLAKADSSRPESSGSVPKKTPRLWQLIRPDKGETRPSLREILVRLMSLKVPGTEGPLGLGLGFWLKPGASKTVWKTDVTDNWSMLIRGAQGRGEELLKETETLLEQTKVPDVNQERKEFGPGILRGVIGMKRKFLTVTETRNRRLRAFQMFLGARDYGLNLDVYWYLTYRPSWGERLLAFCLRIPGVNLMLWPFALILGTGKKAEARRSGGHLNLFDQSDLRAYVTNAHHCMLDAVDKVMLSLNQDPTKIDRKSRGFLGIS